MAAAVALAPNPPPILPKYMPLPVHHSCPKCGTPVSVSPTTNSEDSKRRIAELETQVRILTDKATAAADKLADYEDEVRRFRIQHSNSPLTRTTTSDSLQAPTPSRPSTDQQEPARPTTANSTTTTRGRFSFLSGRRTSPGRNASPQPSTPPPLPLDSELKAQLQKEQQLRQQAEGKLQNMNIEIEELSAQLFTQANEMVASERKARARLEERVAVLEHRDEEKRRRLERLEGAMKRIERVKGLLAK